MYVLSTPYWLAMYGADALVWQQAVVAGPPSSSGCITATAGTAARLAGSTSSRLTTILPPIKLTWVKKTCCQWDSTLVVTSIYSFVGVCKFYSEVFN